MVNPDFPDYQIPTIFYKQQVGVELITHWKARLGEVWTMVTISGALSSHTFIGVDILVPAETRYYFVSIFASPSLFLETDVYDFEISFRNLTKDVTYCIFNVSPYGPINFTPMVPWIADAGELLRILNYNATPYTQNYFLALKAYKIVGSPMDRKFKECKKLSEYLFQPGTIHLEFDWSKKPLEISCVNYVLYEACRFKVVDYGKPTEKVKVLARRRF